MNGKEILYNELENFYINHDDLDDNKIYKNAITAIKLLPISLCRTMHAYMLDNETILFTSNVYYNICINIGDDEFSYAVMDKHFYKNISNKTKFNEETFKIFIFNLIKFINNKY